MYEIKLKIGGVEKTFAKDFINIADNMLAVEHQVRQTAIVNNEKSFHDPKKHHTLNEEYLKMFVEMFGNQFSIDDLKQADIKLLEILNKLYIDALGGKSEEGDEKKGSISPQEAKDNLLLWIKDLMQNGYTILDIKKMQLSDIELMVEALEKDKKAEKEEVEEGTLDKAFPFLFG